MPLPFQGPPENSGPDKIVTVLAVAGSEEDFTRLSEIFSHTNWVLRRCSTCREAAAQLRQNRLPVVVCSRDLPDGSWKDVLQLTHDVPYSPLLVVASRHADDALWGEVLNMGGYDVLPTPFDRTEVVRTLSIAWLHWKQHNTPRLASPRLAMGAIA